METEERKLQLSVAQCNSFRSAGKDIRMEPVARETRRTNPVDEKASVSI